MARTKAPEAYKFTVAGYGKFPIDMLRYSLATPASETDSNAIEHNLEVRTSRLAPGLQTITLRSVKDPTAGPAPSAPRWKSFGWTVTDVKPA